ncbi:hypothetical protein ABZZ36_41310 [Actinacidiphila glaucinigra]|uniref:hypothetical protein n=1 Tax=Actinacidiphila glaucinigra TaxID=235986 RepID=UPI00339DD46F
MGIFLSAGAAGDEGDIWILYLGASLIILVGLLFAMNVAGIAYRFFSFVVKYMQPGRATPRTLRLVGVGWVVLGTLMLMPEIVQAFR